MDKLLLTPEGKEELKVLGNLETYESMAGCTGNVVLVTPTELYCANCGDSRSIL